MYVLGLIGLGVSPAACVVYNGKLMAFAEEERFNRYKGSFGLMPTEAVKFCMQDCNISLKEIDRIAFGWDAHRYTFYMPYFVLKQFLIHAPKQQGRSNILKVAMELLKNRPDNLKREIESMLRSAGMRDKAPPIQFVNHHLAHAASCYYTSGFSNAHILVLDGSGEERCTSILKGDEENIRFLKSYPIPHSLGWFYQSITEFLGFKPNQQEGKLMALAAYGKRNLEYEEAMKKMLHINNEGYTYQAKYSISGKHNKGNIFSNELEKLLGKSKSHLEPFTQTHYDIAFAAQETLEKIVVHLCKQIIHSSDFNGNLCLAGGVALNCKLNGVIAQLSEVKNLFVPPVSGEAGVALGAALVASKNAEKKTNHTLLHANYGPEFSSETIKKLLVESKISFEEAEDVTLKTAQFLSENKTVAWFQGRMEMGQRALGNRSILASPLQAANRDYINSKIKNRELWRPFAASILEEYQDDYLKNARNSPFMAIAFQVKKEAENLLSAAIHVDNTTRPQLVSRAVHPKYWQLIHRFGEITGVYALLNTSFNTHDEPIVCTPQQALKSFYATGIDVLVIDKFIIEKKPTK